jgi:hypothetical protein
MMKQGVPARFNFSLNINEFGYRDECIKGAFEFETGKFIVWVNGSKYFHFA